ncbi:MAG: N-acetyl-gamma-glutamyl-phosphate reductase, partial [Pseudomonadota bacterium]
MISAAIVGGTGYTGVELVRLLAQHPAVDLRLITSRGEAGTRVDCLFPSLRGHVDLVFSEPDEEALAVCDVIFFATPHNVAMRSVPGLLEAGARVIDLSADFRLRDVAIWEQWYGEAHQCPELLSTAVYGLPERHRGEIATADLVACPGCYPTAVQLGFMPLLGEGLVDRNNLIANAASGVSGAGKQAKLPNLFAEVSDSFKAYGVDGHRHLPEIEQGLSDTARAPVSVTFVPHLAPMVRGIHATLYASLTTEGRESDLQMLFESYYANEPFVDVLPGGVNPQTRNVRGANVCQIAVNRPQARDTAVVTVVEDNLVKGAAGQAVQCMNIMFGFAETEGL